MHPRPRGSAEILATARAAQPPPPPKKPRVPPSRRPRQPNPLWSNPDFTKFPQCGPGASNLCSVSDLAVTLTEKIYKELDPTPPCVPQATLKFIPESVPNDVGQKLGTECSLQPDCTVFASSINDRHTTPHITNLCRPDISGSPETLGKTSLSDDTLLSRAQRIEELVLALRNSGLSPFDLVLAVLDESNPSFSSDRDEFYKVDNKQLSQILYRVSSNSAGRNKLDTFLAGD